MKTLNSGWKYIGCGLVCLAWMTSTARGDGGTPRFGGEVGDYHMTVFTSPTPVRAGLVDISVLLQDRRTGEFVTDVAVNISVNRAERPRDITTKIATSVMATNKCFRAASFEFNEQGLWTVQVEIPTDSLSDRCSFSLNVGPRAPRWVDFIAWIGLPVIPIALFTMREAARHRGVENANRC